MTETSPPDPAKARFIVIQVVRLTGVALVLVGLLMLAGRWPEVPREAGYVLTLVGLFEALAAPTLLARRWKSPPP